MGAGYPERAERVAAHSPQGRVPCTGIPVTADSSTGRVVRHPFRYALADYVDAGMEMTNTITQPALVWYVSYGSNMCADRLGCYLAGGVPAGASRGYSGCRERRAPLRSTGYRLAGGVYFATESAVWGGGRAFYDADLPGTAAARAYLITSGQFADIASQEMYRATGADLDLTAVLAAGRVELG